MSLYFAHLLIGLEDMVLFYLLKRCNTTPALFLRITRHNALFSFSQIGWKGIDGDIPAMGQVYGPLENRPEFPDVSGIVMIHKYYTSIFTDIAVPGRIRKFF